jgi:hypothetical protein
MNTKALLTISLGLNVITLGVLAYLVRLDADDLRTQPPLVFCFSSPGDPAEEPDASAVSVEEPFERFTTGRLESAAFKQYVTHLRRLGCPNDTIRFIIMTDVSEMFRKRVREQAYTANHIAP